MPGTSNPTARAPEADRETLRSAAQAEVGDLVDLRICAWAPLTSQERDILVDWVVNAVASPAEIYDYPIEERGGHSVLFCMTRRTATSISSDGKVETLSGIADALRIVIAEVRTWVVWHRIWPGPLA